MEKTITLVRGLPGSGKSTFAQRLGGHVREADMYFISEEDGSYNFDKSKISVAHDWCKKEVESIMKLGENVVVSNTFTQEWEMEPYVELAKQYDYKLFSIIVENRHGGTNVHGCPEETVQVMKNRFSIQL